ncbi:unnamed protein product [Bemisia tabaci]|uniref:Uncharacterized protein n=1 Tax=Bemisia tabaci TaxID=7038 RepID=A0A9P0A327_BEMTA|nr:unnamed protein product [Bemisia tabaci]
MKMKIPVKKISDKKGKILGIRRLKKAICLEATADKKEDIIDMFKTDLKQANLEVKEVTKDIVTVKIESVPQETTNGMICEELTKGIDSNNIPLEKVTDNIQFLRRRNAKQWGRSIVYARLGGEIADLIIKEKEFYMGYSGRVRSTPSICIMACGKCGDFQHSQRFCEAENKICFKCGASDHERGKCKTTDQKCLLCARHKRPSTHGFMTYLCPLYREAVEKQLAREGVGLRERTLEGFIMENDELTSI